MLGIEAANGGLMQTVLEASDDGKNDLRYFFYRDRNKKASLSWLF